MASSFRTPRGTTPRPGCDATSSAQAPCLWAVAGLALTAVAAFAGCRDARTSMAKGNGVAKSDERPVTDVTDVDLSGVGTLEIRAGASPHLTVTGDENLLPFVRTIVKDHRLTISTTDGYAPSVPLVVSLVAPDVHGISVSGAGTVRALAVHGEAFTVDLSGTGSASLEGRVRRLDVSVSGAGKVTAADLAAADVHVNLSGRGKAEVRADGSLSAEVSGVGVVAYRGAPKVTQSVTGLGRVVQM